jgi:hypothetical protein
VTGITTGCLGMYLIPQRRFALSWPDGVNNAPLERTGV